MTEDKPWDDPTSSDADDEDDAQGAGESGADEGTSPELGSTSRVVSFGPVLPAGFAQSLLPNVNPLADAIRFATGIKFPSAVDLGIQYASPAKKFAEQLHMQHAEAMRALNPVRPVIENLTVQPGSVLSQFVDASRILDQFRQSIAPYAKRFAELPRLLLPPNLREVSEDISAADVLAFLEEEGIPLYLIPRAVIGRRLVLAKDHAARRKVLNERFTDIVDDCIALLAICTDPIVATEIHFVQDGIGALQAGYHASAQAIFTVTLDTLISRFYPDREQRRKITNRTKGSPMPDEISDMGIRDAYVWLPVWNAHQQFWQHKGDSIPNDYSRHATVHGVSSTQFNKRNCAQSLMLACSLVGYAHQLAQASGELTPG